MSSYFELRWRDNELDQYETDKLNYIYNAINHSLTIRYKQYYKNELIGVRLLKSTMIRLKRLNQSLKKDLMLMM